MLCPELKILLSTYRKKPNSYTLKTSIIIAENKSKIIGFFVTLQITKDLSKVSDTEEQFKRIANIKKAIKILKLNK